MRTFSGVSVEPPVHWTNWNVEFKIYDLMKKVEHGEREISREYYSVGVRTTGGIRGLYSYVSH